MMALLQRHLALLFRQHYHLLVVLVLAAAVVVVVEMVVVLLLLLLVLPAASRFDRRYSPLVARAWVRRILASLSAKEVRNQQPKAPIHSAVGAPAQ